MLRKTRLIWGTGKQMVLAYIVLMLLPVCLLLYYYFNKSQAILEKEVTQSMLLSVKQVEINVSYRLSKVNEISDILIMNADLYGYLSGIPRQETLYQQSVQEAALTRLIHNMETNDDIRKVRLFINPDKLYAREHVSYFGMDEIETEPWYGKIADKSGGIVWLSREDAIPAPANRPGFVLSSARIVKDPLNVDRIIGVLVIDVPEMNFADILQEAVFSSGHGSMFLINEEGTVLSSALRERIGAPLDADWEPEALRHQDEGILTVSMDGHKQYLIYKSVGITGWKLVALVPTDDIQLANTPFSFISSMILILLSLVLFLFCAFAIFAFVTERMLKRVRQISVRLKEEGIDAVGEHIRLGSLVRLDKGVIRLIGLLKEQIEENYRTREREREAQLRALQAQINPHFLYNALDAINWMALTRGATDISVMLKNLAQYFRLSLNRGKDTVTVEDEINLAKAYLEIQKQRFHTFQYSIDVPREMKPLLLPKLTLQPIIENAILHGIQSKQDHQGFIRIRGWQSGQEFALQVEDNGNGMAEDRVEQLMAGMVLPDASSGYGLYNVNQRVRIFTGGDSGISIHSEPDHGTTVTVRFRSAPGSVRPQ